MMLSDLIILFFNRKLLNERAETIMVSGIGIECQQYRYWISKYSHCDCVFQLIGFELNFLFLNELCTKLFPKYPGNFIAIALEN